MALPLAREAMRTWHLGALLPVLLLLLLDTGSCTRGCAGAAARRLAFTSNRRNGAVYGLAETDGARAEVPTVLKSDDSETAAAPVITWGSFPIKPGQTVLLSGSNFPAGAAVSISGVNRGSSASAKAITAQSSSHSLKFVLPESLQQDVFAISVAGSRPYFLNAPDVWSVHGDLGNTSTPGGSVRLIGRGLAAAQGRGVAQHESSTATELMQQLTKAVNAGGASRSEARALAAELQRLLLVDSAAAPTGGTTQLRLAPTEGGPPVILTVRSAQIIAYWSLQRALLTAVHMGQPQAALAITAVRALF